MTRPPPHPTQTDFYRSSQYPPHLVCEARQRELHAVLILRDAPAIAACR